MVEAVYTTKSKEELRKLNEAGDVETYYRVWATSKGGTYFHVDVSEKELNSGKAVEMLTKKAQALDAV